MGTSSQKGRTMKTERVLEVVADVAASAGLGHALSVTFLHTDNVLAGEKDLNVYTVVTIVSAAWFLLKWIWNRRMVK